MEIRAALDTDFDAYCALLREIDAQHAAAEPGHFRHAPQPSRPRSYWEELLKAGDKAVFFAFEGGKPLGLAQLKKESVPDLGFLIGRDYAQVGVLVVAEQSRREGVGGALMERAEAWAREKGCAEVRLNVWGFNLDAQRFYAKRGYRAAIQTMLKKLKD